MYFFLKNSPKWPILFLSTRGRQTPPRQTVCSCRQTAAATRARSRSCARAFPPADTCFYNWRVARGVTRARLVEVLLWRWRCCARRRRRRPGAGERQLQQHPPHLHPFSYRRVNMAAQRLPRWHKHPGEYYRTRTPPPPSSKQKPQVRFCWSDVIPLRLGPKLQALIWLLVFL